MKKIEFVKVPFDPNKVKTTVTIKGTIEILGIEQENLKNYNKRKLKKEFNYLLQKYDIDEIYLKEDYGIYCNGAIMESTTYLFAIDNLTNSKKK